MPIGFMRWFDISLPGQAREIGARVDLGAQGMDPARRHRARADRKRRRKARR